MRTSLDRVSCSAIALAAGSLIGVASARAAVFTFSATCDSNWSGTCQVANGCGVGIPLNQNNWGLSACAPGVPAQPGAGDDVVFPINATINVLSPVASIGVQPGVAISDQTGVSTTSGVTNTGVWSTTAGNKSYVGPILNAASGTWTAGTGGWTHSWTDVSFVNQGQLNLAGVVVIPASGTNSIDNQGTISTPSGVASTLTDLSILNSGTIDVTGTNLTLSNCTYAGSGSINVSSGRTLSMSNLGVSGPINGSSAGTLQATGTLVPSAPTTLNVSGNGLVINGNVDASAGAVTNTGVVDVTPGNKVFTGSFTNGPGATWDEDGAGWTRTLHSMAFVNQGTLNMPGVVWTAASGVNTLANSGSLNVTAGVSTTITGVDVSNSGTISTPAANLTLSSLAYSGSGSISVPAGRTATLGNVSISGPLNGTSAGTLQATGTLTSTAPTTLNVSGNGLALNGHLDASAGAITNVGAVIVTAGNKAFTGSFANAPGATYTDANSGWTRTLNGFAFINDGTLTVPGAIWALGTGTSSLTNTGTIQTAAGTGFSVNSVPVTNDGLIDVAGSNLTLSSLHYSGSGSIQVGASRTATLNSCTYSGVISGSSSGVFRGSGVTTTAPTTLDVSGAGFEIHGPVDSTGGLLTNANIATITAGNKTFTGNFTNALGAIITDNSSGWTRNFADGVFTNAGTLSLPGSTVFGVGAPAGTLLNTGTMRKHAGGTFTNGVATTNEGLWDVELGGVNQTGSYTQASAGATTRVRSGAAFARTTTTFDAGRIEGLGTFTGSVVNNAATLAPGQPDDPTGPLTVSGTYTQGSSGTLEISIGSRPPAGDDRVVTNGAMNLDGTLRLKLATNFAPTVGDVYEVARSNNNQRNGTFSSVQVIGRFGATFLITYTSSSVLAEVTGTYCAADIDDGSGTGTPDGGITIDDLLYFLPLFDAGDPAADFDDGSGTGVPDLGVTIDDLIFYLARFDAGC